MKRREILPLLAAAGLGWSLEACVPPIEGAPPNSRDRHMDFELGATVQRGSDPPMAPMDSKGCMPHCVYPVGLLLPEYGVGFGVVAGVAYNIEIEGLTLRPYAGARMEHYFEAVGSDSPTSTLSMEVGLGFAAWRLELRPTFGLGFARVAGTSETVPVATLGFSLSTRVFAGLVVGMFFHQNRSPMPDPFSWGGPGHFGYQSVDAPILGLEMLYRFRL